MIRFLFVLFMLFMVLVQSSDKNIEPKSLVLSLINKSHEIDLSKNNLMSSSNSRDDASVGSDSLPKTSITDSVLTKRASSVDLFGFEKKRKTTPKKEDQLMHVNCSQIDRWATDFFNNNGGDKIIGSLIYKIQCYFYKNHPKGKKDFHAQAKVFLDQHLQSKKEKEFKQESCREFVDRIVSYDTPRQSASWKVALDRKLARKQGLDVQKGFTDDDTTDHSDIES